MSVLPWLGLSASHFQRLHHCSCFLLHPAPEFPMLTSRGAVPALPFASMAASRSSGAILVSWFVKPPMRSRSPLQSFDTSPTTSRTLSATARSLTSLRFETGVPSFDTIYSPSSRRNRLAMPLCLDQVSCNDYALRQGLITCQAGPTTNETRSRAAEVLLFLTDCCQLMLCYACMLQKGKGLPNEI